MVKGINLTLMIGRIRTKAMPRSVIEAVRNVQVTTSAHGKSGFQIVFAVGKNSAVNKLLLQGFFDPPRRVIILVTINGQAHVLIDGVITQHELTPSNQAGQSTLTITGEDLTRMMDRFDLTGIPFAALPPAARVLAMLRPYVVYGIVPAVIPSLFVSVPNPVDEIPMQQGTDLQYINALANQVGYVFYIDSGPVPGMNIAYWGPAIKVGLLQPPLYVNSDAHNNAEIGSLRFDGFSNTLYVILIVGIELWRAAALGFGGGSSSFPLGLSPTPMTHVSIGPPTIPDGRISRVRF